MDGFLDSRSEDYLSGELGEAGKAEFERRLIDDSELRNEIDATAGIKALFGAFRLPSDGSPALAPGFHNRVLRRIAAERKTPFWEHFFGWLGGAGLGRRQMERPRLHGHAEAAAQIRRLFDAVELPPGGCPGPAPGFHNRVLRRIAAERKAPFWELLVQPPVVRRLALASFAWLLALVSTGLYQQSAEAATEVSARVVLAQPPESADYCNVRLGPDIERNRSSMLMAVMDSGLWHD